MPELRLTKDDLITIRHALRHEVERGQCGSFYQRDVRSVISKIDAALLTHEQPPPTPPTYLTDAQWNLIKDKRCTTERGHLDP